MAKADPLSPIATFRALVEAIITFARGRITVTLLVVGLAALLEGVGLALLLPVAETLFATEGNEASPITTALLQFLSGFGIDTVLGQLLAMGAAFVILVALRAVILLQRDLVMAELSQGFVDHTRREFFALLAQSDWPVIKRFRKAQLLNTMTTNIARLAAILNALSRALITLAMACAYLISAFVVSKILGLLLLGLSLLGLAFAAVWVRRSHRLGTDLTHANRGVMQETTRFLDGMKAAKAARAEAQLTQRFNDRIAESRAVALEFVRQQGRVRNAVQVFAALAALAFLLAGFGFIGLSGGELLIMVAIFLRLAPNFIATFHGIQTIAFALPAFESIREIETRLEAVLPAKYTQRGETDAAPNTADGPLILRDACVQVAGQDGAMETLVRCRKLDIAPGTLVHILGPSGSGKSTLVEMIAGLHLPASGVVSRGDLILSAETCAAWQSSISFAPQEPFLFDDSVRANLLWPNLALDDAQIWHALEQCEAAELVRNLPDGLDHNLLDGGARLSGGERQRLCLARAMLRPANLLILDEATAAIDPELERKIVANLRANSGQRTVLLVSHSLNAEEFFDQQIRLDEGEVVSV